MEDTTVPPELRQICAKSVGAEPAASTSSLACGAPVEMPTLPVESTLICSVSAPPEARVFNLITPPAPVAASVIVPVEVKSMREASTYWFVPPT